jgi:hypothetical protein
MPTYTEFNSDMFLCNNLDTMDIYKKNGEVQYTPRLLKDAIFFNITGMTDPIKEKLKNYFNTYRKPPFYIDEDLYTYLLEHRHSYDYFINNQKVNDKWIYSFGDVIKLDIETTLVKTDNSKKEEIRINYTK